MNYFNMIIPIACLLNSLISPYERPYTVQTFSVSAYTSSIQETDDTPCLSASGVDVCKQGSWAACPSFLSFNTVISVDGVDYKCVDRMARRYRDLRFIDLHFTDRAKALQWGRQTKRVKVYANK